MKMFEILMSVAGGGIGVALLNWFLNRKKSDIETKGAEIDNVSKAVKIWEALTHDLREEVQKLRNEIEELKKGFEEKCNNCEYKKNHK